MIIWSSLSFPRQTTRKLLSNTFFGRKKIPKKKKEPKKISALQINYAVNFLSIKLTPIVMNFRPIAIQFEGRFTLQEYEGRIWQTRYAKWRNGFFSVMNPVMGKWNALFAKFKNQSEKFDSGLVLVGLLCVGCVKNDEIFFSGRISTSLLFVDGNSRAGPTSSAFS